MASARALAAKTTLRSILGAGFSAISSTSTEYQSNVSENRRGGHGGVPALGPCPTTRSPQAHRPPPPKNTPGFTHRLNTKAAPRPRAVGGTPLASIYLDTAAWHA